MENNKQMWPKELLSWDNVSPYKEEIKKLIIDTVDSSHCCRVGWACKYVLFDKYKGFNNEQNNIVLSNCLDKIAAYVCLDSKYIKEYANNNFDYDWNIRINPAHKKKWYENAFIMACIAAVFSILGSYVLQELILPPPRTLIDFPKPIEKAILHRYKDTQIIHDTVYFPDTSFRK